MTRKGWVRVRGSASGVRRPASGAPADAVCVLASGGLDSAVLVHAMAQRYAHVYPLYVRAGLVWEAVEQSWLRRFLRAINRDGRIAPLTVARLPVADVYGTHWSLTGRGVPGARTADSAVYLPGRNLLLLSQAAVFCAVREIPRVAMGPLKGNPFPDATPAFFRGFGALASRALGAPLRVLTPFAHLTKTQVIRAGRDLPLALSFSCMRPVGRRHCGACNKCAERRRAFRAVGVPDRTAYAARAKRRSN